MPILRARKFGGGKSPGVIHCFSGDAGNAEELVGMGFFIGVDGPVTYPKADKLRAALAAVPAERLVLETDSPYLPPQSVRGQRNEPARLPEVGLRLAQEKGLSADAGAQLFYANSLHLFRLDGR
jgi:TatD DNase family protein